MSAVGICSVSAITAAGFGVEPFWQALLAARPGLAAHDFGDPRIAAPHYVAVSGDYARADTDLATALLARVVEDALARCEVPGDARVGLLCGSSLGGMTALEARQRRWWGSDEAGPGISAPAAPLAKARYDGPTQTLAARLAPSAGAFTLNTACSSTANALGISRRWLRQDRIDVAVVAGFDVISPFVYSGFAALGALDPAPTTPFGKERRGLNLGEAAIAFVLARDAVQASTTVELRGYGSSCDAHHLTRPDLGGHGLARAINACLRDAGASAASIDVLSAHGTGTPYNDQMEDAAYRSVFGVLRPPVHCAKPVFGHTLGAAGGIDALAMVLALEHRMVPGSYLRGAPDPELGFAPSQAAQPIAADALALSTSSGFGGSNAALLFGRRP